MKRKAMRLVAMVGIMTMISAGSVYAKEPENRADRITEAVKQGRASGEQAKVSQKESRGKIDKRKDIQSENEKYKVVTWEISEKFDAETGTQVIEKTFLVPAGAKYVVTILDYVEGSGRIFVNDEYDAEKSEVTVTVGFSGMTGEHEVSVGGSFYLMK